MRYDNCLIKESRMTEIPSGNFIFIPNGLAEKVKEFYDWKQSVIADKAWIHNSINTKKIKVPRLYSFICPKGRNAFKSNNK